MAERTTEPAEEIAESIGRISSEAGRRLVIEGRRRLKAVEP
jgi:hypothetical protein